MVFDDSVKPLSGTVSLLEAWEISLDEAAFFYSTSGLRLRVVKLTRLAIIHNPHHQQQAQSNSRIPR